MDELLDKMGLYQRSWIPYDKVIKSKSDDYTILTKRKDKWIWYNEDYFNKIVCDQSYKDELIKLLSPEYYGWLDIL
jgi:hypothetical protein